MNAGKMASLFRTYITDRHGDKWKQEKCFEMLSAAQQELANIAEESFANFTHGCANFTVTAATDDFFEFTLPTDFTRIERAEKVESSGKNTPATYVEFFDAETGKSGFDVYNSLPVRTHPVIYIRGNKLGVIYPGEAYTLRMFYLRSLTELDDADDVCELPAAYHSLVVLHAVKIAMPTEGGRGLSPDQRDNYDRQMAAFLSASMHRNVRVDDSITYVAH
jgi:hypothetical protein